MPKNSKIASTTIGIFIGSRIATTRLNPFKRSTWDDEARRLWLVLLLITDECCQGNPNDQNCYEKIS
jgi:hypothetical protein